MSKNSNLHAAKTAKNDEFYTRYEDIDKEVQHYWDQLKGKKIYCPCDDYRTSNFVRYFKDNYGIIGLAGLTATNYDIGDGAWKYTFDGRDEVVERLEGDGDFRSPEITAIMDEHDVVITNPPFSLWREFFNWVNGKKFLIIGNMNAITYKEVFPLIKNNKLWLGCQSNTTMEFQLADHYQKWNRIDENGKKYGKLHNAVWFTNIPHAPAGKPLILEKRYSPENYPKYDNYNAIEVSRVADIPVDYYGVMGVPITFLDKYCPDQFEIVGIMSGAKDDVFENGNDGRAKFYLNNKGVYARILIKRKDHLEPADFEIVGATESEGTGFSNGVFSGGNTKQALVDGNRIYKRIFIRRK